jgi:hypothetical protein
MRISWGRASRNTSNYPPAQANIYPYNSGQFACLFLLVLKLKSWSLLMGNLIADYQMYPVGYDGYAYQGMPVDPYAGYYPAMADPYGQVRCLVVQD